MRIRAVATAREAVSDRAIVCTVTAAGEPILDGTWLEPGTHINAVGACLPTRRELDSEAVRRSLLFTDRMESLENEAGDYLIPLREGVFDKSHALGEIGDILVGKLEGRRTEADITLFKSLGIGVEDLAAAWHVYRKAMQQQIGTWVELGSAPDATA
jgi:ornithine cyclodeaminase